MNRMYHQMIGIGAAFLGMVFMVGPCRAQSCAGDCDRSGDVTVDELVTGVRVAEGSLTADACEQLDRDGSGRASIDELIDAVAQALSGCPDQRLRLNHMQVVGSHNSYHIQPQEPLFSAIIDFEPAIAVVWEYTHLPLDEQFDQLGVRQIELDVFADPAGGLFSSPAGLRFANDDQALTIAGLDEPGFKVLHVQDIDFETTCQTFVACLETIQAWSRAHPGHVPLMVLIEAKDDVIPDPLDLGFLTPVFIGPDELDEIDEEIRSVFPPSELITPDDVRGERATLEQAVSEDGWPTLGEARGRVLFALDNGGDKRDAYVAGHPSLNGRVMFTSSPPGEAEAGFIKLNDPIADFDRIQELVAAGFIVRTRADSDTLQARSGDTTQRDAAIESGAQFVSTDYPISNPDFGTGYQVEMPGGMPARCNPVSAPQPCESLDIEDPAYLAGHVVR